MLTPIELQNKTFKSGGLGYDKKDVDQFFHEVTENYLRLYSENIDLKDKVTALNDALQQYKTMEKMLQRALVLAEKTAEDTKEAAIKNARNIEKEAQTKSQIIMADARNELEHIHAQTLDLLQQFEKYKAQFKSLAAAQIELLESESYSINAARLEAFINTTKGTLPQERLARLQDERETHSEPGEEKESKAMPLREQEEVISRRHHGEKEKASSGKKAAQAASEEAALTEEDEDGQVEFDFIDL